MGNDVIILCPSDLLTVNCSDPIRFGNVPPEGNNIIRNSDEALFNDDISIVMSSFE